MNFSTIKMGNTSVKNAAWVAPKSSVSFAIPAGASGDVVWTLITDYGSVGKEHRARL
jgi:P pilus assembly chaperone PapD